jgi:arylsulfatase A-like enzyme
LDILAKEGVQFTRAYANSTVCSPSRASILFGIEPDLLGVPGVIRDNPQNTWGNLIEDVISLPARFKEMGYQTGLIGKWHLGYTSPDLPLDRGFDKFQGFLGDMMDDYYTHDRNGHNWMRSGNDVIITKGHATELFTDWTLDYISQRVDSEAPFFLFLAYNAPHDPVQPPQEFLDRVSKRLPNSTPKRQKLVAMVEHLDENIGKILKLLRDKNLVDETIIVFTSDNGGALNYGARNAPFRGGKGDMWEGGIRVPCIVSWPGKLKEAVVSSPFQLKDFYTILPKLATANSAIDVNASIMKPNRNEVMFWVRREGNKYAGMAHYAVSNGQFKLLQNTPFESFQLFHIGSDSTELHSIKNEKIENELKSKLTQHILQSGKIPWQ